LSTPLHIFSRSNPHERVADVQPHVEPLRLHVEEERDGRRSSAEISMTRSLSNATRHALVFWYLDLLPHMRCSWQAI